MACPCIRQHIMNCTAPLVPYLEPSILPRVESSPITSSHASNSRAATPTQFRPIKQVNPRTILCYTCQGWGHRKAQCSSPRDLFANGWSISLSHDYCPTCQGYGHCPPQCPNQRDPFLDELDKRQAMLKEESRKLHEEFRKFLDECRGPSQALTAHTSVDSVVVRDPPLTADVQVTTSSKSHATSLESPLNEVISSEAAVDQLSDVQTAEDKLPYVESLIENQEAVSVLVAAESFTEDRASPLATAAASEDHPPDQVVCDANAVDKKLFEDQPLAATVQPSKESCLSADQVFLTAMPLELTTPPLGVVIVLQPIATEINEEKEKEMKAERKPPDKNPNPASASVTPPLGHASDFQPSRALPIVQVQPFEVLPSENFQEDQPLGSELIKEDVSPPYKSSLHVEETMDLNSRANSFEERGNDEFEKSKKYDQFEPP